ncbi:hypothetical protein [Streptomyces sp. GC420]|nr:hypothetical protein [Streptomyces sp. GC420]
MKALSCPSEGKRICRACFARHASVSCFEQVRTAPKWATVREVFP